MPITRSAKKALRQNVRRRLRNFTRRRAISELKKKIRVALGEGRLEEAKELLKSLYKAVDKAAKTGAIKKGTADRIKSRIAKKIRP
jgi:small subunit ribosomal protein S20